jgi:peptidoglycan-associated lipoprotein
MKTGIVLARFACLAEFGCSHTKSKVTVPSSQRPPREYNLALGDKRARAAAEYLRHLGILRNRIEVVTFGDERPKNPAHDDVAWAINRRDDIVVR